VYQSGQAFSGEYYHQLDEKCRIKLPAKLLNTLLDSYGRECRMIRMPEKCLAIYPKGVWEGGWSEVLERMGPRVPGSADVRAMTRIAGATSLEITIAAQGRVSLSESFRRYLEVAPGDNVAVVGADDRIEIWKAERWEQYIGEQMSRYEEIAERTMGLANGNGKESGR